MILKIKIEEIITESPKAMLLLVSSREIWVPKLYCKRLQGGYVSLPAWLADQKNIWGKPLYNKPKHICPKTQSAISELVDD